MARDLRGLAHRVVRSPGNRSAFANLRGGFAQAALELCDVLADGDYIRLILGETQPQLIKTSLVAHDAALETIRIDFAGQQNLWRLTAYLLIDSQKDVIRLAEAADEGFRAPQSQFAGAGSIHPAYSVGNRSAFD